MARSEQIDAPTVWPRTAEGYCSCPYCTAIRSGALPIPETRSIWAKRVSGETNPLRNADWEGTRS